MATNVYVNTAAKDPASAICLSAVNTGPDQMLTMVLGDKVSINLYLVNGGSYDAASGAVGYTVKVGIGPSGANPTGGTYTLTYGGDTTSALAYNASAATVSTALNLLASIIAAGGVTVSGTWPVLTVVFSAVGARTAITAAVDALTPTSSILISEFQVGDGSTRSKQGLRFVRTPAVYQDTWAAITDGWSGTLDLNTFELADLLGTQSALFTDLEIEVTDPDGNRRTWGKPSVIVRNEAVNAAALVPVGGATYLTETESDLAYVQNRSDITGFIGGTATDLDSILTASGATSVGVLVAISVSGSLYLYRLTNATTAESSPNYIRPDDYATTTNERVWVLVSPVLTHWTESNATYSGSEYTKWVPSSGTVNVSAIVAPKGTGAFMLDTPDGASTGGNNRGSNAVDLQTSRSAAADVASGNASVVIGGASNRSTGYCSIAGGLSNIASADYAVAFGNAGTASALHSTVIGGSQNQATAEYSIAAGDRCSANGIASFAFGSGSIASKRGQLAIGTKFFNNAGDVQFSIYNLTNSTSNATQTELYLDGVNATERLTIENDSAWTFEVRVVAFSQAGTEADGWRFFGVIKRGANAAATAIVGTVVKEGRVGSTSWDFDVDADTTNGSLRLQATGEAAKSIYWSAVVQATEIISPD